jgi:hypothetical protein
MGVPFDSGQILGLRRWTASSVGEAFTSIWHRDADGAWTFYESAPLSVACSRWFGAATSASRVTPIELAWTGPTSLHVTAAEANVDWTIELGTTAVTRIMSAVGSRLPLGMWTSPAVLSLMGAAGSATLGAGRLTLRGSTANNQQFKANPLRIWRVVDSHADIGGSSLGRPAPLNPQARIGDFRIPQRGIFAVGQVFVSTADFGA